MYSKKKQKSILLSEFYIIPSSSHYIGTTDLSPLTKGLPLQ